MQLYCQFLARVSVLALLYTFPEYLLLIVSVYLAFVTSTMDEDGLQEIHLSPVLDADTGYRVADSAEEQSDDSDSEYGNVGSDNYSYDSDDGDAESHAYDDGGSTDGSRGVTESESSDSDPSHDSDITDGCDSSDESNSGNSDDSEETCRQRPTCDQKHCRTSDDYLTLKLSKLKLKEDYGKEDTPPPKANSQWIRKGGTYTAKSSKKNESRRREGVRVECTYIYIMTDNGQRFKVGRSIDPGRRHIELRTGNPDLKLLDWFKVSSRHAEVVAHRALGERYRRTREWFYGTHEDIKSVVSGAIRAYRV